MILKLKNKMTQEQINNNFDFKILVIDDDPAIQMLLKRTLSNQGYQITTASDGEEGLALAKKIIPAMIICDWLMPKMNGLDVCKNIKSTRELSSTFFILLTALDSISDCVKGLDAGSDDFLRKPIEMYELQARVRSGLRLHKLNHDLQKQKQILEEELSEAAEYVSSILPEPLENRAIKIDTRFIPSRNLGGDSFDYYWLDENNLAFYLLDVSGHGLKAALPSLSVINLVRNQLLSEVNYYQPSNVLKRLNDTFQVNERQDKYFTMWYGVYNIISKQLRYSTAGHPPAILINSTKGKSRKLHELKTNGFPVGMFRDVNFQDIVSVIKPGYSLYIFSDGVYEIRNQEGKISSLDNFLEILTKYVHNNGNNLDNLIEEIKSSHDVKIFEDDLSIMEIKFF
jgi:sigma-B regulation protein RsbU (phosphoserine phosphatase)